jgi:hypothetical protein
MLAAFFIAARGANGLLQCIAVASGQGRNPLYLLSECVISAWALRSL